jgi:hypothetical protein
MLQDINNIPLLYELPTSTYELEIFFKASGGYLHQKIVHSIHC